MTHDRMAAIALTMALVARPSAAQTSEAPGVFRVPGTSTTLKFNGQAVLIGAYDFENRLPPFGTIVNAITEAKAKDSADGFAPKRTWTMSANRTRFGVTTNTPSDWGEVTFKLEGDFLNGVLRLRHGYGTLGNLVFGQTWSTFLDLEAAPETVDFTGSVGSANFDTPRIPQLRYTFPYSEKMSLAVAVEADRTDSTDAPFPGSVVGAFTYRDDWGHVGFRLLSQIYSTYAAQTPTTPEAKYGDMVLAWQLSGHYKLKQDTLRMAIVSGRGLGAYGAGTFQDIGQNDVANQDYSFWKSTGITIGYAHPWNERLRSNAVLSRLKFKGDHFATAADIEKVTNLFLNTFLKLTDTTELGVEYVHGKANAFGNGLHRSDGSPTNAIRESRIQGALVVNLF